MKPKRGQDADVTFDQLTPLQSAAQDLVDAATAGAPKPTHQTLQRAKPDAEDLGLKDPNIVAFRAAQHALWQQLRRVEINWRITDFITLGPDVPREHPVDQK